jgi:hypothetical protein
MDQQQQAAGVGHRLKSWMDGCYSNSTQDVRREILQSGMDERRSSMAPRALYLPLQVRQQCFFSTHVVAVCFEDAAISPDWLKNRANTETTRSPTVH